LYTKASKAQGAGRKIMRNTVQIHEKSEISEFDKQHDENHPGFMTSICMTSSHQNARGGLKEFHFYGTVSRL